MLTRANLQMLPSTVPPVADSVGGSTANVSEVHDMPKDDRKAMLLRMLAMEEESDEEEVDQEACDEEY